MRYLAVIVVLFFSLEACYAQQTKNLYTSAEPWSVLSGGYTITHFPKYIQHKFMFPSIGQGFELSWRCMLGKHWEFGPMVSRQYYNFDGNWLPDTLIKANLHEIQLTRTRESFRFTHFMLNVAFVARHENWVAKAFAGFGGNIFSGVSSIDGYAKDQKDSIVDVGINLPSNNRVCANLGTEVEYQLSRQVSLFVQGSYTFDFPTGGDMSYKFSYSGANETRYLPFLENYQLGFGLSWYLFSKETREQPNSRIIKSGD